jgi:hypothetical protein
LMVNAAAKTINRQQAGQAVLEQGDQGFFAHRVIVP